MNAIAPQREIRFELTLFNDISVSREGAYLVRSLIPAEGLVTIWGPPKCGKSFFVSDLALHVALGWEYRDHRVKQGTVIYIALEGERGLTKRIEAFRRQKLPEDAGHVPFYLLTTRLDLAGDWKTLVDDIRVQLGTERCAVIVIDTLNRSLAGSESSDQDMGAYIKAADSIREAFQCAVIIVHHCGLDSNRPRGHSSLVGAVDAQIAVSRDDNDVITAEVELMKDGETGAIIRSRLKVIDLDPDENGDTVSSCVVEPAEDVPVGPAHRRETSGAAKIALDQLRNAITDAGEELPASNHMPQGIRGVDVKLWRRYCDAATVSDSEKPDSKSKAFKRSVDRLLSHRNIGKWENWVWIV
jgi:hypothetical protein